MPNRDWQARSRSRPFGRLALPHDLGRLLDAELAAFYFGDLGSGSIGEDNSSVPDSAVGGASELGGALVVFHLIAGAVFSQSVSRHRQCTSPGAFIFPPVPGRRLNNDRA